EGRTTRGRFADQVATGYLRPATSHGCGEPWRETWQERYSAAGANEQCAACRFEYGQGASGSGGARGGLEQIHGGRTARRGCFLLDQFAWRLAPGAYATRCAPGSHR